MVATEMMVDELAGELNLDPIELRLRNVFETGMKNPSGSIPAGVQRFGEVLQRSRDHPLWAERAQRKQRFERGNPGLYYGVGYACVQKNYGTGAEAALVQIETDPTGALHMRHVAVEIGTGCTTSMMQVVSERLETEDEPYTTPQAKEDELARNPRWVPRITSPRSASNAADFLAHATREAARILFERGLWQAAVSIWSQGAGGGQAGPLVVRREDARWVDGRLMVKNLEPLPFGRLAAAAHARGLVTGVTVHTFNRWAWAEAEFDLDGEQVRWPIDALSLKYGNGARDELRARMSDGGYAFIPRTRVYYPPTKRANGVTYYAPNACLVELSVNPGSGEVRLLSHHSIMKCGRMIVPEFVLGQLGCKACEVACKEWNALPADDLRLTGMSYDNTGALGATTWRHVAFIEKMRDGEGRRVTTMQPFQSNWLMMSDVCKHCSPAPCLEACPTGAIFRTEFDTVVVQQDICNGRR